MIEYSFPKDLLETIKTRWQSAPNQQFTLPEDRILLRLLETCYHASLRTSEQRTVECVVAYVPIDDIPDGALELTHRPVLTDTELVRLSPVTQRRQTVIGCGQVDGWLRIWGFFEFGHAWVQHAAGDPPAVPIQPTDFPPDCLTITIEGPGALTISQGKTALVRLRDGRVIFPQENLFETVQNPLGAFFHQLVTDLDSSEKRQDQSDARDERAGERTLLSIYTKSVLAILERIRLRQHGGTVVITRVPFNDQLAHVTYRVPEHIGLADEIMCYQALDALLRFTPPTSNAATELEHLRTELSLGCSSRRLIREISQISLLAAADGAVLLDQYLRIQGFGVRFPVQLQPGATVLDALTQSEYPCDQWGLRHQSVFSLCQECEQAIGFIVSQDGEVKAARAVNGRLFFWDGILD